MMPGDILLAAADVVCERGLTKREFADVSATGSLTDCPVCTVGAIAVAAGDDPDSWNHYDAIVALLALGEVIGVRPEVDWDVYGSEDHAELFMLGIGRWNDVPERTDAEVIAALQAAAESLAVSL